MASKKFSKFPPKKPKQTVFKAEPKRNWSDYQKEIFKSVAKDSGHLIVEALAGSGKTSTILEALKYVPKGKKIIVLAFNKIIQEELAKRAPRYYNLEIMTFHSYGLRSIKHKFGSDVNVDNYKTRNIVSKLVDDEKNFDLIDNLCQTISFCKYTLNDSPSHIKDLIARYGIDLCDIPLVEFTSIVIKALGKCKLDTKNVDFDDMCWFHHVHNLRFPSIDYVFVDERQDLNLSRINMAEKMCNPNGGRMIMVGDSLQTLYGWLCADVSVFEKVAAMPTTKTLTLPVTYRCPKKVVKLAKNWANNIECPDNAADGEIDTIHLNDVYRLAKPGCFILSRTNAPLIKICLKFISLGIKANIRGRDVGSSLNYLIKKSKKKTISAFLKWLENWRNESIQENIEKGKSVESIHDRYECLVSFCEDATSLEQVVKNINDIFNDTDEGNIVILSSVHRAKGLEKDDVFLLEWTFRMPFDNRLQNIEKPNEEANINYVAMTRTRKRLFFVVKDAVSKDVLKINYK